MASPFSLSGKKKDKAGGGDYNALLKKNMARYKDRDEAVRKTNIATGHGNSTAQRFMHGGGEKPGSRAAPKAAGTDRRKTSSTKRKGNFSLPESAPIPAAQPTRSPTSEPNSLMPSPPPGIGSGIPTPPMPTMSPDMAVSPPRPPDPMSAGAPQGMGMSGTGYVPPMSFDLGVSPQHPADPMARSAPQPGSLVIGGHPGMNGRPISGMGGPVGAGQGGPVGMGGPVGAGNPLISTPPADDNASWIKKLLGLA